MDTDKAYLLGLIIGGGIFGNAEDVFRIRLPYKQWGSYEANPQRAGQIATDIMKVVGPLFRAIYGLAISYEASVSGEWIILCDGDLSDLKEELTSLGITCEGEVRKTANINLLAPLLIDDNLKRRFIAGLADTIGSTKRSHRRFTDEKQMISFEINGFEFNFVCSLCKLLHSIQCYPDQILWNHPNFHCALNPYDTKWKKGFKLRVFLDQYEEFGAFAFASKVTSSRQNQALESQENVAIPCPSREIRKPSVTCVHCDENSPLLPEEIRGGHYLHNRHVCAVLQCEHAPYTEVRRILNEANTLINPFPVLTKGTNDEIRNIVDSDPLMRVRTYQPNTYSISSLTSNDAGSIYWGRDENTGYPATKVVAAITFLIAAKNGQLNGLRPRGKQSDIIRNYLCHHPNDTVTVYLPDLLTPLVINMGEYSVMVGPDNPYVYKQLISFDQENTYKMRVRPITEEDLQ